MPGSAIVASSRKASLAAPDEIDADIDIVVDPSPATEREPRPKPKPKPTARRRGRPVDSDGLTRERILVAARECFAEAGYTAASTHMVASRVGLTTGALYHHFGSKRELYLAVFTEVEQLVDERFRAVATPHATFVAKVEAILDETGRLSTTDPAVAGFALSVTGDVARHPDLREAFTSAWARRDFFFGEVVDAGIATGELAAADRTVVLDTVTTLVTGLLVISNGIPVAQARAVEGAKRLLAGTLIVS
jgi:AcrR family transcriptional regulator